MGEAVMSCEGDVGLKEMEVVMKVDVSDGKLVMREKFSPRTALRILLVEADDSTRQVIGVLLRKCGYKVSAVSDGLKAWEVLKGMPNGVDLILTEVDLPLISGFALLTLIMEHDSCKNIPVIMMSSNDSVNMVYKCMLRGAADFLVKPVRKNELQNLWQHVWRRQTIKSEGLLSDNDQVIDLSNEACTSENKECSEKGNDVQSSCSVQDIKSESANAETTLGNSKLKVHQLVVCNTGSNEKERIGGDSCTLKPNSVVKGSSTESDEDAVMMIQQEDPGGIKSVKDCNTTDDEASGNNDALINGSREVIDLMGNFLDHSTKNCANSSVITGSTKFDPCPQLDLSLRRRYDDSKSHQETIMDESSQALHQSSASAFSRYIAVQPSQNIKVNTPREIEVSSDQNVSSPVRPSKLDGSPSYLNTQKSLVHQAASKSRQGDVSFYYSQGRMLPVTIPLKSVRLDRTCTSNGSSLRPSYYNQTSDSPTPSPDSVSTIEVLSQVTQVPEPYTTNCDDKAMEHLRNAPSTNDRNQSSNFCNGGVTRLNSVGGSGSVCGSNGSGNGASKADGISTQEESINRLLQREAALTKFRQKRKDRCFDKKVRYESRKKLAEQRPRVKGQFVRRVSADVSTSTIEEVQ